MQLKSGCLFWVVSAEDSAEAAIQAVKKRDLPLLQAALSIRRPMDPYRLQILWSEQDGQRTGALVTAKFGVWSESELMKRGMKETIDRANTDFALLAGDPIAFQAVCDFSDAILQMDTCITAKEEESVLTTFFKVIERVARTTYQGRSDPAIKSEEHKAIQKLRISLEEDAEDSEKIRSIKAANNELGRLETRFLGLQVSAIGQSLGLSDAWTKAAHNFIQFRHKHLGHTGPPSSAEDRAPWLRESLEFSACSLARTLLAAYVDHKAINNLGAPNPTLPAID
jgi:hypothetical protein